MIDPDVELFYFLVQYILENKTNKKLTYLKVNNEECLFVGDLLPGPFSYNIQDLKKELLELLNSLKKLAKAYDYSDIRSLYFNESPLLEKNTLIYNPFNEIPSSINNIKLKDMIESLTVSKINTTIRISRQVL